LRNIIFVFRAASGTRAGAVGSWPDPATMYWDTRPLDYIPLLIWQNQMKERYGYASAGTAVFPGVTIGADASPGGQDASVFAYDFTHEFDGHPGFENRDLWIPTIGSTRWEIGGTWGTPGTLYVLTNDVSVSGNVFM
jgi:hypothetical protein